MESLSKYLASKKHQPHQFGVNDCNTFIVEWIDLTYGTDWEGMLQFDYDSALGAARFHRHLPFSAEEFMHMAGYDDVMVGAPKSGDVLLQNLGPWFCAWLVALDYAYTVDHKLGFVVAKVNTLEDYTVWRREP